jgi:hypothetical protein
MMQQWVLNWLLCSAAVVVQEEWSLLPRPRTAPRVDQSKVAWATSPALPPRDTSRAALRPYPPPRGF